MIDLYASIHVADSCQLVDEKCCDGGLCTCLARCGCSCLTCVC